MSEADRLARGVEYVPKQYTDAFFEKNPGLMPFHDEIEVHHAIPQAVREYYPDVLTVSEMHSVENLRGIPRDTDVHADITKHWNRFIKDHPQVTREELLDEVRKIDKEYGNRFLPPVRAD